MALLIFKIFKSQNKTTFKTFREISVSLNISVEKILQLSAENSKSQSTVLAKEIVDIYRTNKTKIHQIAFHLGESYILPYDREDILEIINNINDISKLMVAFAKKRNYYTRNFENDFEIVSAVEVITEEVNVVSDSLLKLRKFKQNNNVFLIPIDKLKQANKNFALIFERITHQLFDNETTSRELVMKQDILDVLEKLNNKTAKHIRTLEALMVKYG